jgi:hypothetical protein
MTLIKIFAKPLIIYLLISAIWINASNKLNEGNSLNKEGKKSIANSKKRIARPTKPTRPTPLRKLHSDCAIETNNKTNNQDGKKVTLKSKADKLEDTKENDKEIKSDFKEKKEDEKKEEKSDFIESVDSEIPKLKVNWFDTKLKGKDLGVNSQGELYVVGADNKLYLYEFLTNSYVHIEGHFDLTKIFRVDVSWEGVPYVVTETGDTYYLSCDHKWMRLSGCATDIATGRGGEVFKTGCDERENGFGIYKLFCNNPVTSDFRGCLNFRKPSSFAWTHKESERTCEWFRIDGNGVRIDVAPNGNPYIIDKNGDIYLNDGTEWRRFPTKTKAYDLTLSNDGVLFYIGQDANIYKSVDEIEGKWIQLEGQGTAITAGPFGHPWVIQRDDSNVVGTAKYEYN